LSQLTGCSATVAGDGLSPDGSDGFMAFAALSSSGSISAGFRHDLAGFRLGWNLSSFGPDLTDWILRTSFGRHFGSFHGGYPSFARPSGSTKDAAGIAILTGR